MSQPQQKEDINFPPYAGQPPPPYFSSEPSVPYTQQNLGYGAPGFAPTVYPPQGFPVAGTAGIPPQVIIHQQPAQTVIVGPIQYGPHSMRSMCLSCQKDVMTSTNPTPGTLTWVMCIMLAFMGLDCGCCLIPFCCDSCQDTEHRCPECGAFMGIYQRAGRRY